MIPFFQGAAGGAPVVSQVFAATLYTGDASARTITTGINTSGPGGMAWFKSRSSGLNHYQFDTLRSGAYLISNDTAAEASSGGIVCTFGTTGLTIGTSGNNANLTTYVAWSFARAARFFDVVTYTGTGANRTVSHSLGTTPGMIIVKRRDTTSAWPVYHRSNTGAPETDYLLLNAAGATADDATYWNDTTPTASVFTVGTNADVNASGGTYVAYLFAHDTASDGIVQCGSYTGNQSPSGPTITLGWQPQFLIFKNASATGDWIMMDTARGIPAGSGDAFLRANTSDAEVTGQTYVDVSGTGFSITAPATSINGSGNTIVYLAIRA